MIEPGTDNETSGATETTDILFDISSTSSPSEIHRSAINRPIFLTEKELNSLFTDEKIWEPFDVSVVNSGSHLRFGSFYLGEELSTDSVRQTWTQNLYQDSLNLVNGFKRR